jgi:hypothetical protein
MANIRLNLEIPVFDGQNLTFRSPSDCSAVTGLTVYYPKGAATASKTFQFADSHGNNVGGINLFASNVLVKVILDTQRNRAYVQNADTNAYLEGKFDSKAPLINIGTYEGDIDSLDIPINSVAWITPNTVNNPRSGGYAIMETLGSSNATRVQRLTYYDSTKAMMERMYTKGKWYPWATKDCYDSVVAQGTSGIWTYRKWSSGLAECWCKRAYSVTTKANSAVTLELGDALPFAFTENPVVHMSPTEETAYQHWFGAVHANTSQLAYAVVYAFAAKAVTGTAMVSVVGRWK